MEEITRTEKLLSLILLQGMDKASQKERVVILNKAGFSNIEIANLLETTTATVSQSLYENKSTKKTNRNQK
jgi:hypothetical protein